MNIEKITRDAIESLRARGHDDDAISRMNHDEAFDEYCNWQGLIGWGPRLRGIYANLSEAEGSTQHQAGINADLLEGCKQLLGYVEMKLAHIGCQTTAEIMTELNHVQKDIAVVEAAHHFGCPKTTRTADLGFVRAAIARAEAHASGHIGELESAAKLADSPSAGRSHRRGR